MPKIAIKLSASRKGSKKRKNTGTKGMAVVVQRPDRVRLRKRAKIRHVQGGGRNSNVASYGAAMRDPFSISALGCKVPDLFGFPTSTFKLEATFQLASSVSGVSSAVLLPLAYLNVINCPGTIGNLLGLDYQWANNTGEIVGGTSFDTSSLVDYFSTIRTVAVGYQVTNLLPALTTTGRLIAAAVPITGAFVNRGFLVALNGVHTLKTDDMLNIGTGIFATNTHVNSHLPSSILSQPTAVEVPLSEISGQVLAMNHTITGPEAFQFQNAKEYSSSSAIPKMGTDVEEDYGVIYAGAGNPQSIGSMHLSAGRDAILLRVEGVPASTAVLEVKVIFHMEGTPWVTNTTRNQGRFDSAAPSPVSPWEHMEMLSDIAKQPFFKILKREAFNRASSALRGTAGGGRRGTIANLMQLLAVS